MTQWKRSLLIRSRKGYRYDRGGSEASIRGRSGYRGIGRADQGRQRPRVEGSSPVRWNERSPGQIRVRDQDRTPAAPDIKRIIREMGRQEARPFGLKIDVKDAHRFIPTLLRATGICLVAAVSRAPQTTSARPALLACRGVAY